MKKRVAPRSCTPCRAPSSRSCSLRSLSSLPFSRDSSPSRVLAAAVFAADAFARDRSWSLHFWLPRNHLPATAANRRPQHQTSHYISNDSAQAIVGAVSSEPRSRSQPSRATAKRAPAGDTRHPASRPAFKEPASERRHRRGGCHTPRIMRKNKPFVRFFRDVSMTLTMTRPDDWAPSPARRRDDALRSSARRARTFARAVVMPNLMPPVTTVAAAAAYRDRILLRCLPASTFAPLMTLYLTDTHGRGAKLPARASGFVIGAKYYPAGRDHPFGFRRHRPGRRVCRRSRRWRSMACRCWCTARLPTPMSTFSIANACSSIGSSLA